MVVIEPNREYLENLSIWTESRDCMSGQNAVKGKGEAYLPIPGKTGDAKRDALRYEPYKKRALFFNVTKRTVSTLTGAAMRKSPVVELPDDMQYLIDDADDNRNSLDQLANSVVSETIGIGRTGLLVDFPKTEGTISYEDVRNLVVRPSIKQYAAESMPVWRTKNGKLSLVILQECYEKGLSVFEVEEEERFRVLRIDESGYYVQSLHKRDGNTIGEMIEEVYPTMANGQRWTEIPFIFPGSVNNSPDVDYSPIHDLAVVNLAHYRNSASYEEGIHLNGQPMYHIDIGSLQPQQFDSENPDGIQVGSLRSIITAGGGSVNVVQAEANGAAFEAMEHKERLMLQLGARLVEKGGVNESATAALIDSATEHSVLSLVVKNVSDAIEKCLRWCAMYHSKNPQIDEIKFKLNDDFFDVEPNPQMIAAMLGLEDRGHIAQSDIRGYLRKSNVIDNERTDEDIDAEAMENAGV